MALKKQATPKRWRSKEAKEIIAAVQRAGGQVERTASGHLKVIGPAGSAIVASAPTPAAQADARSTTPWPRSGARPDWTCETLGWAWAPTRVLASSSCGTLPQAWRRPLPGPAPEQRNLPSTKRCTGRDYR